jgi:hypothetical protein
MRFDQQKRIVEEPDGCAKLAQPDARCRQYRFFGTLVSEM